MTGKLARLYPRVIAAASGSPAAGTEILLGGKTDTGRHARVRVILVCEIPERAGGGEVVFAMRAAASSGLTAALTAERDSAWEFTLNAERDDAGFYGKLVFA